MASEGGVGFLVVYYAPPSLLSVVRLALEGAERDFDPRKHDAAVLDRKDSGIVQWL